MSKYSRIPVELLRECLVLQEGRVIWKIRPVEHFVRESSWKRHNTLFAGKEFGGIADFGGQLYRGGAIRVDGKNRRLMYHVAVWVLTHGKYPDGIIDHIDGCGLNNSIENLKDATHTENTRNAKKRSDNKSGITGVHWHKKQKRWIATGSTVVDGKPRPGIIGTFIDIEDARMCRVEWEATNNFSDRHGT